MNFHGDSVSIDTSLSTPSFGLFGGIETKSDQFINLPDGLWASLSPYAEDIACIFEISNGKLNGKLIRLPAFTPMDKINDVTDFEEYTFVNNEANGKFIEWWDSSKGIVKEEGYYRDNLEDSVWIGYYARFANYKLSSEKRYSKGMLHGIQKEWHANGKLKSIKTCVNDHYIGAATQYYSNGQVYMEINYLGGTSSFAENYTYVNTYDQRGTPMVVDGEGIHKIFDENGEVWKQGPVKNGLRHGIWIRYPNSYFPTTEEYVEGVRIN